MSNVDVVPDPRIEALHQRLAENSLGGHWQPRAEQTRPLVPFVWKWSAIYSCLMESGEVIRLGHIDEAAKRRTVNLVNPTLLARKATSRTLQMSVQLVKPGEMAECHRHTAGALRFAVEGDGTGYTNVEGEQMLMEPGDLVLTPNWTWHDHQNPGQKNLVWLDVLDTHLTTHLDAGYHENYSENAAQQNYFKGPVQPVVRTDGYCRERFGAVRVRTPNADGLRTLPYAYKWRDTLHALKAMDAAGHRDPYEGILVEYVNPLTGGPTMPTIGCRAQMLAPGETTRPHRHTSSTIYHVIQGEGVTTVGAKKGAGEELVWGERDCFFVPSKDWRQFRNTSKTAPAILFSVTDRPVLESLGLYREEHG
jgi:gentisate 1,2-dioxygenase